MNKIRLLPFVIYLSFISAAAAQNIKPKFKKFTYVTYRSSGSKTLIRPETIVQINSQGIIHVYSDTYFDNSANLYFTGILVTDTTYQAPDNLIVKLNKIFDDKSNLVQPIEFRKSHKNQAYDGPYIFVSFTDSNDDVHNLVIADLFDVNIEFRKALIQFWRQPANMIRYEKSIIRDRQLEATILKCHNSCKNLPQLRFMNIEVADPRIKH